MPYQPHRGNPETKQYFVVNNLVGGMNTLSADDVISTIEAREVLNMNIAGSGAIVKRKGFAYANILNSWLEELSPTFLPDGDMYFVQVVKNEGNLSKYIEEFDNWEEFRNFIRTRTYNFHLLIGYATGTPDELGRRTIVVELIKLVNQEDVSTLSGGSFLTTQFDAVLNAAPDGDDFTDFAGSEIDGGEFVTESEIQTVAQFNNMTPAQNNLTNIDIVSFLGKHYILLTQLSPDLNGILEIDEVTENNYEFKVINSDNPNNLYKPSPLDLDLITSPLGGYNMLYNIPKDYVKNHTAIRTLRNLYITSFLGDDAFEDFSIPLSGDFRLNIIFTGYGINQNSFVLKFYTEDIFGNRKFIAYKDGHDPYANGNYSINDAIAQFEIKLDLEDIDPRTILVSVDLVKEEDPVLPVRQFDSELALLQYYVTNNHYIASTLVFQVGTGAEINNNIHSLLVRNTGTYNFTERSLLVYRQDDARLANRFVDNSQFDFTHYYVLKDNNKIYKVGSRTYETSDENSYEDSPYQFSIFYDLGGRTDYNDFIFEKFEQEQKLVHKLREGAEVNILLYNDFGGPDLVFVNQSLYDSYLTIIQHTTPDIEIGSIVRTGSYIKLEDIENKIIQAPSTSDFIPQLTISTDNQSGEIYLIDNRENILDEPLYYKYNSGTEADFTDFSYYTSETETKINQTVEYPVQASKLAGVEGIDFDSARILEIEGRLVAYKGNTIWFSDFRRFNYFPSTTYFNLAISSDDEITSINYFRGSYIVFTRKTIWKMRGNIDQNNLVFEILNDSIGCVAPKSVRPFNNTLVFMSIDGLYRIKQNFYLDGLENVEKIDKRIPDVLPEYDIDYESMLYDEQYLLFIKNEDSEYSVLRHYYNVNLGTSGSPFVVDKYAQDPEHMFEISGALYAIKDRRFWKYDQGYTDFLPVYTAYTEQDVTDATYITRLHLPNFSFGYATHDKKFKNIFIKTMTDVEMPLYITIKIDGYEYASPYDFKVFRDADGIIQYEYTMDLKTSTLGDFIVGEHRLGESDVNQHKIIVGGKGKNITLILEQASDSYFGITNIGYLFKLGKVRGDI